MMVENPSQGSHEDQVIEIQTFYENTVDSVCTVVRRQK